MVHSIRSYGVREGKINTMNECARRQTFTEFYMQEFVFIYVSQPVCLTLDGDSGGNFE